MERFNLMSCAWMLCIIINGMKYRISIIWLYKKKYGKEDTFIDSLCLYQCLLVGRLKIQKISSLSLFLFHDLWMSIFKMKTLITYRKSNLYLQIESMIDVWCCIPLNSYDVVDTTLWFCVIVCRTLQPQYYQPFLFKSCL